MGYLNNQKKGGFLGDDTGSNDYARNATVTGFPGNDGFGEDSLYNEFLGLGNKEKKAIRKEARQEKRTAKKEIRQEKRGKIKALKSGNATSLAQPVLDAIQPAMTGGGGGGGMPPQESDSEISPNGVIMGLGAEIAEKQTQVAETDKPENDANDAENDTSASEKSKKIKIGIALAVLAILVFVLIKFKTKLF